MKQEQNGNVCCMDCGGDKCCHNDFHGGSGQLLLLRWLLGLLILVITFVIAFKLGEFKQGAWSDGGFRPAKNYRMMRGLNNSQYPPMMQFEQQVAPIR